MEQGWYVCFVQTHVIRRSTVLLSASCHSVQYLHCTEADSVFLGLQQSCLPHLSSADKRAMVVLNKDGDFAIIKGKWTGFQRHRAPEKGASCLCYLMFLQFSIHLFVSRQGREAGQRGQTDHQSVQSAQEHRTEVRTARRQRKHHVHARRYGVQCSKSALKLITHGVPVASLQKLPICAQEAHG